MKAFFNTYKDQIGLLLLWLLIIAIVNPIGDFPLNDDWCYGKSVKTLFEDGYLKLYNWGEMTLVGHVYWGYLFTKVFGFSFTVLRWSTLVLGFTAILGIYQLCKLANISRWISLFGAVLCMVNPIFLSLSFSFMTDVPFYCFTIWAFYFFAKAIKTDSWQDIFFAMVFCVLAFLIRQLAWVFPLVWLITVFLTKKHTHKNLVKAIMPLVVLIVFSLFFSYIMELNDLFQERYNSKFNVLIEKINNVEKKLFLTIFSNLLQAMTYIGFLLMPIHLFYSSQYKFKTDTLFKIVWTVIVTAMLIKFEKVLPSLDNIWIDFGVGPTTLHDHSGNFTTSPSPHAPELFWQIVTAIGVFSSVALLFNIREIGTLVWRKKEVSPIVILSFVFCLVYLAPFLIVGLYDRYLLPLFPFIIIFLGAHLQKKPRKIYQYFGSSFLGLLLVFSVCAVHDHLSWNRERWKVINGLMDSGVAKNHISGGVEFVTWYHFSEKQEEWWGNVVPVYTIVFKPNKEDQVLQKYDYSRWLPGKGEIYLVFDPHLAEKEGK